MNPTDLAVALERIAKGFHDLSVAVAGGTPTRADPPLQQQPQPSPVSGGRQCSLCGQLLELKQTKSGDPVMRCPAWRWNNGESNGHDSGFVRQRNGQP